MIEAWYSDYYTCFHCLAVECKPSCGENGVCVENNTCSCSEGFSGTPCTESNDKKCEEVMKDFCLNGGKCEVKGVSAICNCEDAYGYTGIRCEEHFMSIN